MAQRSDTELTRAQGGPMRFTLVVPYTDLADKTPRVCITFIEASDCDEAQSAAEALASDARQLMDLTVDGWRDLDELKDLDGLALLREYGIAFGDIQVWCGEHGAGGADSPFTPSDVNPGKPPAGLLA